MLAHYWATLSLDGSAGLAIWLGKELAVNLSQTLFLLVLLLVSLGWTITRQISQRERYVLSSTFGLYCVLLGFKVDCERADEDSCQSLILSEYVVRSIILLAIIVSLNFNVGICAS